ncbi:MAG: flavodoxin [Lachnospiraceae bacterium]|nr:flavodoxin [Lachnospiraceae bacterium]
MKKTITLLLAVILCFSLAGCGTSGSENEKEQTTSEVQTTEQETTEAISTSQENTEVSSETDKTDSSETLDEAESNTTLVVYFSNTGNTKAIAEHIANGLSADIYEIIAKEPYTDADLDYNDNNSRSTLEMNDPSARPDISGTVENMEQYDTVYIGYPIWWGEAPRILSTFVESYDFTGKTVIPFCTSASSGVGSSADNLAEIAGTGDWIDGQRFSGSESQDEVMEWVNGL